jgi:hypothetical protein
VSGLPGSPAGDEEPPTPLPSQPDTRGHTDWVMGRPDRSGSEEGAPQAAFLPANRAAGTTLTWFPSPNLRRTEGAVAERACGAGPSTLDRFGRDNRS